MPPNTGLHVAGAAAINDRGEIVAAGRPADGSEPVIVLIPCDEKHAHVEGCDHSLVDAQQEPLAITNGGAPVGAQTPLNVRRGPAQSRSRGWTTKGLNPTK